MDIILFFAVTAAILVTLGGLGLYFETNKRISDLEAQIRENRAQITQHKNDIRVIKEREAQRSDKIVIVNADPDNAPEYGGF